MAWLCVAVTGILLSRVIDATDILLLVRLVSGAFLFIGILNELFQNTLFKRWNYRFAGTLHPNQQGLNCAILALSTIAIITTVNAIHITDLLILAIAILCLVATKSRSASICFLIAVLWYGPALYFTPAVTKVLALFFSIGILAALFLLFFISPKTVRFELNWRLPEKLLWRRTDKIKTLTGRTLLWKEIQNTCNEVHLLGFGYGAYWTTRRFENAYNKTGWRFSDCHSAYMETMTGTGKLGLIMYYLVCSLSLISCYSFAGACNNFNASFFILVMVHGYFESSFALPNYFTFLFFLIIGNSLFI